MALSVAELAQKTFPLENWIIPGLLTRQNTAFLMGPPKSAAKSWLLLDAAFSLSIGEAIWGISGTKPPREMRTVYFTQEDTERDAQSRIGAHLNGGGRKPNDRLWIVPKDLNYQLDTSTGVRGIAAELEDVHARAGEIDLIIFDPMRRILTGDENSSQTIAQIWSVIDKLHHYYDCAIVISHHIVKPPRDRNGYDPADPYQGRGSGDIYGGGDAFVMVVPGVGDEFSRKVELHFESKRAKQMPPASVKVDFHSGRVSYLGVGRPRNYESSSQANKIELV